MISQKYNHENAKFVTSMKFTYFKYLYIYNVIFDDCTYVLTLYVTIRADKDRTDIYSSRFLKQGVWGVTVPQKLARVSLFLKNKMMPKALDNWVRGMIMEFTHNLANVLGFSKVPGI